MLVMAVVILARQGANLTQWRADWQSNIVAESKTRYCDTETGEEIGWLISPFLSGFYYGYLATHDTVWIDRLTDWTDSLVKRAVKEPDGYLGWPKQGTGGLQEDQLYSDSLLGEAMAFKPVVLLSHAILSDGTLKAKYGDKARGYIAFAEAIFKKWDSRHCWREVPGGGLWVVPAFGIDKATGGWTASYAERATAGFTNPDNKENAIAEWLLAMFDATGKPIYRSRAEKWFQVMKSRIKLRDGKYNVWDYWDPGGPWDYKADGSTRHWVGVHPNGGYYGIDVEAIVDAYRHGLVFKKDDIDRLIATNRDYMWNGQVQDAKFQSIGGGPPDPRWKDSPGVLWSALVPYDSKLRHVFEANFKPASWSGLAATPWYVAQAERN